MDNRKDQYIELLAQIESLIAGEENQIANLSNIAAAIFQTFKFHWVGFYFVDKEDSNQLVLGPFQGPVACTRINKGKGVCGTAWLKAQTQLVSNVHEFEGHIACSSFSNSEIVVPLFKNDEVWGVLDIDSINFDDFTETDRIYLEKIARLLA